MKIACIKSSVAGILCMSSFKHTLALARCGFLAFLNIVNWLFGCSAVLFFSIIIINIVIQCESWCDYNSSGVRSPSFLLVSLIPISLIHFDLFFFPSLKLYTDFSAWLLKKSSACSRSLSRAHAMVRIHHIILWWVFEWARKATAERRSNQNQPIN